MKERPILFSAPMVRAILEGRKTVTRRVVKPQPPARNDMINAAYCGHPNLWLPNGSIGADTPREWKCPYGQPGDRLWVRETWAVQRHEPCLPHERDYQDLISPVVRYRADGSTRRIQGDRSTGVGVYHGAVEKTRVSIHMPRWASRITLEVTGVRVERLQDISTEQAVAEGMHTFPHKGGTAYAWSADDKHGHASATGAMRWIWDQINGEGAWHANPWVWVVEFRRVIP